MNRPPAGSERKPAADAAIAAPISVSFTGPLGPGAMGVEATGPQEVLCPGPVDHDSLAKAIRRSVGHDGMRPEDARTIAAHVLNFFGFNERIIDNVLEPDDRDTFYMLEDTGILETERDETTLYDGREWRIHYWMIRKERISELAREETEAMVVAGEKDAIYSTHAPRSIVLRLPHGELGTGLAAHAVYHELGDDIWTGHEPNLPPPETVVLPEPAPRTRRRAPARK